MLVQCQNINDHKMTTISSKIKYKNTMGLAAMQGRGFYYPMDLAFDSSEKIYVLGRGHDGDPRGCRIVVMDMNEEYYGTFGSFGNETGQFIWPSSIAVNSKDNLFISDEATNKITVMSKEGNYISSFGEFGSDNGQFDGPNGLAFDHDDNLYVVDHRNGRVQVFDEDGKFIRKFGKPGDLSGELNLPWGITIDSKNNLYIADWGNHRIQEFSNDGDFIKSIGSYGKKDTDLIHPSDVAVDLKGKVFVTDWGNHRFKAFNQNGDLIYSTRGEATLSKWAHDFLNTNIEEKEARSKSKLVFELPGFDKDPHEESSHVEKYFWSPTSITFYKGEIIIVDSNRHRLPVYLVS